MVWNISKTCQSMTIRPSIRIRIRVNFPILIPMIVFRHFQNGVMFWVSNFGNTNRWIFHSLKIKSFWINLTKKKIELDSLTLSHSYLSEDYERVLNSKVRLILAGTYYELTRPLSWLIRSSLPAWSLHKWAQRESR